VKERLLRRLSTSVVESLSTVGERLKSGRDVVGGGLSPVAIVGNVHACGDISALGGVTEE
jgi:hypothetical protein